MRMGWHALAVSLFAGLLTLATSAPQAEAGIKGIKNQSKNNNQTQDQGPLGLPGIKRLREVLQLTGPQDNQILAWYNDAKKKEHENQQAASQKKENSQPPNDLQKVKKDLIDGILKILTEDQRKKFQEMLDSSNDGKKKKKT